MRVDRAIFFIIRLNLRIIPASALDLFSAFTQLPAVFAGYSVSLTAWAIRPIKAPTASQFAIERSTAKLSKSRRNKIASTVERETWGSRAEIHQSEKMYLLPGFPLCGALTVNGQQAEVSAHYVIALRNEPAAAANAFAQKQ